MPSQITEKTRDRLVKTDRGAALLSLLDEYGSPAELGRAVNEDRTVIIMWVNRGWISIRGAINIADRTGRMKEEFRPDLCGAEWERRFPGPVPGQETVVDTEDGRLLMRLAEQFGSVSHLCAAAGITVATYHQWKSRGRIPAIKLPTMLMLVKPKTAKTAKKKEKAAV